MEGTGSISSQDSLALKSSGVNTFIRHPENLWKVTKFWGRGQCASPNIHSRPRKIRKLHFLGFGTYQRKGRGLLLAQGEAADDTSLQAVRHKSPEIPPLPSSAHSLLLGRPFPHQGGEAGSLEAGLWWEFFSFPRAASTTGSRRLRHRLGTK